MLGEQIVNVDFLIIGSGVAGLHAAYHASRYGTVALVTKENRSASSSYWAQGGVAAVLKAPDTFQAHIRDTLQAGRNYCNESAVGVLVEEGAGQVQNLISEGMPFDKTGEEFDLGLEGGHSARRVLHANGAATGQVLVDFLNNLIEQNSNVEIFDHAFAFNLVVDGESNTCHGADIFLYRENRQVRIQSAATILATGGYSGLYSRTTNPHTSTGDGLWMANHYGARLKDMEFVQFHPTAFYSESGETFLISEALRGEGARLFNAGGDRFMLNYTQKELAPRDVVAKEIFRQIQTGKSDFVYLDIRHLNISALREKYPTLITRIESQGIDIEAEGIPVAPAAHYCIGGIETDLNAQTSVQGLYACGEAASAGVHGANRLASNSLLECLVFSQRAVKNAAKNQTAVLPPEFPFSDLQVYEKNRKAFHQVKNQTADLLSAYAGIERDESGMTKALQQIKFLQNSVKSLEKNEYYSIRMKGMLKVAERIIISALNRKESRGVHSRLDFPKTAQNGSRFCHPEPEFSQELLRKNAG